MALPQDRISTAPVPSTLLAPDEVDREDRRIDFEMGGVALNDPSQGLQVRTWRAWVEAGTVNVAPWPEGAPVTALFSAQDVTELSLSFDQNMRPVVAYVQAGLAKLYWYDSLAGAAVVTSYPGALTPMVTLDDKRDLQVQAGVTDVLLFYTLGGSLCYRQQRDRYTIERVLATVDTGNRIIKAGMGVNGRMQVWLSGFGCAHADLLTDTLYAAGGSFVVPMFRGDVDEGRWLSRVYVLNEQTAFGWARVEADYPAVLRLFGDGRLIYATPPITSPEPVRLPAIRAREWQIEIQSVARVTEVVLGSTAAEVV